MDALNQVGKKVERTGTTGVVLDFSKSGRGSASVGNTRATDRVELSQESKIVGRARTAVEQASEVRTDRIDALKALIRGQEYPIDARKVADKMAEEHLADLV